MKDNQESKPSVASCYCFTLLLEEAVEHFTEQHTTNRLKRKRMLTLSSHASSRISSASEEIVLFLSCNWVTSNSIPQLLKNSTFALSNTRKCFVAYNLQLCKKQVFFFFNGRKKDKVIDDLSCLKIHFQLPYFTASN